MATKKAAKKPAKKAAKKKAAKKAAKKKIVGTWSTGPRRKREKDNSQEL